MKRMTTIEYTRCMLVIAHDGYTRRTHSRTDRRRAQRIQYTHMNIHKFEFSSPFYSSSAVIFPIVWPRWLHFPMHCMQSTVERRQKSVREIVCTVYTSMFHSFALRIVLVVRVYLLCVCLHVRPFRCVLWMCPCVYVSQCEPIECTDVRELI